MKTRRLCFGLTFCFLVFSHTLLGAQAQMKPTVTPKFALPASGLELERRTQAGSFFDVVGRRAAVFGYEHRPLEAWVYPMKLLDDFELSFRIEGYPLEFRAADTAVHIKVRPEATIFTYSHAAFTVRQIIYAPVDKAGLIMLLDVQSVLPMTINVSFRPKLSLAWPAGLMTGNIGWDEKQHVYYLTEESKRFVGVVGSPAGRDTSVMPYQEEPRDVPSRLTIETSLEELRTSFIPIIIAGSVEGREKAKQTYDLLLSSVQSLYENNVTYYKGLQNQTTSIRTPDERLNTAFGWAKVGVDKGIATNPFLGTGLLAGFRTSGESERPGFAWYFGRDAMWTALAINSYGDFMATRTALGFLKQFQRADGKIPHEISQSASLIPWFTDYEYPWASADATPLYVIAHADYWRATGDTEFLKANWDSILKAYGFTQATDTDNNRLIENTKFGHGWVEGGPLRPAHEELYMQGLWIEASRSIAELAEALKDTATAERARAAAEATRAAMEQTYWLEGRGFYAFSTRLPTQEETPEAEPGPNRAVRQARMEELSRARLIDEDTVLPAVPLWWRTVLDERAQTQIDHLGSGRIETDWGARIISNESKLYDPLSYHYGSVWPLFTGWASMGAYAYGRPHVGYHALMANALLSYTGALGYVTELLSGDFNAPFGRSSHHQVWSEAMVVTPALRGLLGIEVTAGGKELRFAPQLPANWDTVEARNVAAGNVRYDLKLVRTAGRLTIIVTQRDTTASPPGLSQRVERFRLAPSFPLDARLSRVTVQGRATGFEVKSGGDVQRAEVNVEAVGPMVEVVFTYTEGTDVYLVPENLAPGAESAGLRILRARASTDALHLVLEGLGGRTYQLRARTPYRLGQASGLTVEAASDSDPKLTVAFEGAANLYTRRELTIPIDRTAAGRRRKK